jgi:hypothetical protein
MQAIDRDGYDRRGYDGAVLCQPMVSISDDSHN